MTAETPTPTPLKVSTEEYDLLNAIFSGVVQSAQKEGNEAAARVVKSFAVRLKQHVFAGDGIDDARLKRLAEDFQTYFTSGDYQGTQKVIATMISAAIRMHPDPASLVALSLAPAFVDGVAELAKTQQFSTAASILTRLSERLGKDRAAFDKDGWGSAPETLEYIRELVDFWSGELGNGIDPLDED